MSKRLILSVLLVSAILLALFLPMDHSPFNSTMHQHQAWLRDDPAVTGFDADNVLTSHLPLLIIHNDGQPMPGASDINDNRELIFPYSVIDNQVDFNRTDAPPTVSGQACVSLRGNSSRRFPKKQYNFRLVDKNGFPEDTALLGMPAESSWALNGSYIDESLLRNYTMLNLCGELMEYAPRCRICEVFTTDASGSPVYQGVYTLIEKIKVSPARLDLQDYDPKHAETSFLLQMNSHTDSYSIPHLMPDNVYVYPYDLEYPALEEITPQSVDYIEKELLIFEKALYDARMLNDWDTLNSMLDMDSFVDYFLINEFFQNYDAGVRSTFLYKNLGDKFTLGPVWDFDAAFNNYIQLDLPFDDLRMKKTFFYYFLSQNPDFLKACTHRYRELRSSLLSDEFLISYLSAADAYLGSAVQRNCDRWYDGDLSIQKKDLEDMKEFVIQRGAWMDLHFEQQSALIN